MPLVNGDEASAVPDTIEENLRRSGTDVGICLSTRRNRLEAQVKASVNALATLDAKIARLANSLASAVRRSVDNASANWMVDADNRVHKQ